MQRYRNSVIIKSFNSENMDLCERILTKEEINKRFIRAVTAIMMNKLVSSKAGLAESLGVKPAKFSEILNSRMNVGIDMIAIMCDSYGVSADWLLLSRGNNVFRQTAKQAIWVDDDNLNMECSEDEIPDNKIFIGATSNATPISPTEESIIYKMYKEKDEENKALLKQVGSLEERLRQLEESQSTSQDKRQSDEIALAFPSDSLEGSTKSSLPMRKPITSSERSSASKIL